MVRIEKLGLAAYLHIHKGMRYLGYRDHAYEFEAEQPDSSMAAKSAEDWNLDYLNSECSDHDYAVMVLKKHKR